MKTFLALILVHALAIAAGRPAANDYVKAEISLATKGMKVGGAGELVIRLTPKPGIHVNVVPPMSIKLDEGQEFRASGNLQYTAVAKDTTRILDATKPIRQSLLVSGSARPGRYTLKGTLTYYYCSDADGWCSRFRQPIGLDVAVRR